MQHRGAKVVNFTSCLCVGYPIVSMAAGHGDQCIAKVVSDVKAYFCLVISCDVLIPLPSPYCERSRRRILCALIIGEFIWIWSMWKQFHRAAFCTAGDDSETCLCGIWTCIFMTYLWENVCHHTGETLSLWHDIILMRGRWIHAPWCYGAHHCAGTMLYKELVQIKICYLWVCKWAKPTVYSMQ